MKKKIIILAIAIIAIVCCSSAVSAEGLLDTIFGSEPENTTYNFDGVTLEFPETYEVTDITATDDDPFKFWRIYDPDSSNQFTIATVPTDEIVSFSEYISLDPYREDHGSYKTWNIIYYTDDKYYELHSEFGNIHFVIMGDDLDQLEALADSASYY